jgi:hypothetical protein
MTKSLRYPPPCGNGSLRHIENTMRLKAISLLPPSAIAMSAATGTNKPEAEQSNRDTCSWDEN